MSRQVRSLRTPPQSHAVKAPILISAVLCVCGLFLLHRTGLETTVPVAAAPAAVVPHSAPQMAPQRVVPAPRPPEHHAVPKPRVAPPAAPQRTIPRHLAIPAIQANPEGWIDHVPSVSMAETQQALGEVGSPLAGMSCLGMPCAHYIWRAGHALGIDPAAFLGIFLHESHYGMAGMATVTHDPGNLRCYDSSLPGAYCDSVNGGYESFPDWRSGIDATYTLLWSYVHQRRLATVADVIAVWAPPSENQTAAYIQSVLGTMSRLYTLSKFP